MKIEKLPSWLQSFNFIILDEYNTVLFSNEYQDKDFKFNHDLGWSEGEIIMLDDKEYDVFEIQIYSDKNTNSNNLNKPVGYYLNLNMFVREKIN